MDGETVKVLRAHVAPDGAVVIDELIAPNRGKTSGEAYRRAAASRRTNVNARDVALWSRARRLSRRPTRAPSRAAAGSARLSHSTCNGSTRATARSPPNWHTGRSRCAARSTGTLRRLSANGYNALPATIREILRLAVYELVYTKADEHATVFECVNLAKRYGHPGVANLINAVLRRYFREPSARRNPSISRADDEFWERELVADVAGPSMARGSSETLTAQICVGGERLRRQPP